MRPQYKLGQAIYGINQKGDMCYGRIVEAEYTTEWEYRLDTKKSCIVKESDITWK